MTCPLCGDVCGCVPDARPLAISGSHARVERIEDVTERRDEFPHRIKRRRDDPFAASWDSVRNLRDRSLLWIEKVNG